MSAEEPCGGVPVQIDRSPFQEMDSVLSYMKAWKGTRARECMGLRMFNYAIRLVGCSLARRTDPTVRQKDWSW